MYIIRGSIKFPGIYRHLSVVGCTILAMTTKWNKYTHVCFTCDAMIEYTSTRAVTDITCECGGETGYLSVEDATILPTTTKEESMSIIDETPIMVKALQDHVAMLEGKVTTYQDQLSYSNQQVAQLQGIKKEVISLIDDAYMTEPDLDEVLSNLCEVLDYQPIKTIQFEGVIHFSGSMDIPMNEVADFDLTSALEDVYVDINNGNVVIDNYELYSAEEPY